MHSFHFRPGKNAVLALGMAALALLCGWLWWSDGAWLALGGLLLFGAGFAKAAHNAMSSEPALRLEPRKLTVRTTFGREEVQWRDVQSVSLEALTYYMYGFIPMGRVEILCIAVNGGLTGTKRLRVSCSTIDLPSGGSAGLLLIVQGAHLAAVGEAGVVMAGAGPRGWGVESARPAPSDETPGSGFDPDAAIARYLAAKQATGESQQPAPQSRLNPAIQRPTFGRRTA
ncbi:MAG: hypothetical protein ABIS38_04710 [Sphingomicrobium sp.]